MICAEIEAELSELDEEEKKDFLVDLGLTEVRTGQAHRGQLQDPGPDEFPDCRGRTKPEHGTIKVGTKAPQAAGKNPYGF